MIEGTSVDGVIGCTKAIEAQDHLPLIPSIKLPCLIAAGEEDLTTPIKEAFDLHVGIDGSDMVVIPKTRHLANVEAADVFNDVLLTFLKQYS
jgi:3-oxoadipate enol-lactonase